MTARIKKNWIVSSIRNLRECVDFSVIDAWTSGERNYRIHVWLAKYAGASLPSGNFHGWVPTKTWKRSKIIRLTPLQHFYIEQCYNRPTSTVHYFLYRTDDNEEGCFFFFRYNDSDPIYPQNIFSCGHATWVCHIVCRNSLSNWRKISWLRLVMDTRY